MEASDYGGYIGDGLVHIDSLPPDDRKGQLHRCASTMLCNLCGASRQLQVTRVRFKATVSWGSPDSVWNVSNFDGGIEKKNLNKRDNRLLIYRESVLPFSKQSPRPMYRLG